jgi:hypothetical protein
MKKHKKELSNYNGTFKQIATELGDLTYDSLSLFLNELSLKLLKDGEADHDRGRLKLSKCLKDAASDIKSASGSIDKAWEICKPFMGSYEAE